ncbi:FecR family protein [Sphingobacterium sp. DR205]|uniref:FecR family protein n=1 Tax=Sphingobacterium sp. DR205 TaxID=2713573 RepID=UPI0013E4F942|nr:FecR family protein [Sphingobacterium sp. DR205]QIH34468.1 DUF4974 domain-containing protein [Sphingobacterium sp. DR205]
MNRQDINNSFEIIKILKKVLQEIPLTDNEKSTLDNWLQRDETNRTFFENLKDEETLADAIKELFPTNTDSQFKLVEKKIKQKRRIKLIRVAGIAASLVIAFGTGTWLYINHTNETHQTPVIALDDILPGSNKATIKLSTGQSINLDDHQGIRINDSGFSYDDGTSVLNTTNAEYATLITPRGGQYQITLSDGTKVWLNANSSLEYPLVFKGKQREVKLKGEGYFEVAHNPANPFIVKTDMQQIKVLGTVFNLRAYSEVQFTTLIRGSVAVRLNRSEIPEILKPGQQAIVEDHAVLVHKIDVNEYIGWKDGMITGTSVGLEDIGSDIENWYDVDFIYPRNFKNCEKAYINISKSEKLSSVLKAIENTYGVKAEIRGREVFIR